MELDKIFFFEQWELHPCGLYISTEGRAYNPQTNEYTYGWKNKRGYLSILFNGKIFAMHRLVAETFLPNPYHLKQVHHINERKCDNRKSNLEFISQADSINYGTRTKRTCKAVMQFDLEGNLLDLFPSVTAAAKSNSRYFVGNIAAACRGEHHTAYGYIWRYV